MKNEDLTLFPQCIMPRSNAHRLTLCLFGEGMLPFKRARAFSNVSRAASMATRVVGHDGFGLGRRSELHANFER